MKNQLKRKISITLAALFLSLASVAHEGHDHDAPKNLKAPKGGIIKSLEETHVELVAKGSNLKLYLYDKEMKPQSVKGVQISAKAELPRSKKTEDIALVGQDNFYEGTFDAKGAHRYTLILAVTDSKIGHEDKIKFTVEPRK